MELGGKDKIEKMREGIFCHIFHLSPYMAKFLSRNTFFTQRIYDPTTVYI